MSMKKEFQINETVICPIRDWQERFGLQLNSEDHDIDGDLFVDFIEFKSYLNKYGYVFLDQDARETLAELLSIDNSRN